MEIFITAQISDGISFPYKLNDLEDKMNLFFSDKQYGFSIRKIYSGFVCVSKVYDEFMVIRPPKLLRKEPALEFEYKLDFEKYRNIEENERVRYILIEFQRVLTDILISKKIKDFDVITFLNDLNSFIATQNLSESS
ncbi:MAG: hypothetical protein MUF58_20190 [Arcicella sp.]|jgi:hypothetical protein|nr:hypothetical protein [Arcicella sp.]